MPSYQKHVAINLIFGLPLTLALLKTSTHMNSEEALAFCGAFFYSTLLLHPDLDLTRKIRLFSLKGLLTLPFRPYSYLFRHRGISHMPVIGTLTRILWLFLLFTLGSSFLDSSYSLQWHPLFWFIFLGVVFSDFWHIVLDKIR